MANPRKDVRFANSRIKRETFKAGADIAAYDATKAGNTTSKGLAVTQAGQAGRTVNLCASGDPITGRLERLEGDGMCVVTVEGNVSFPAGNGSTVTVGTRVVGALGPSSAKGYIQTGAAGSAAAAQAARGEIIDATDTTAVVVALVR